MALELFQTYILIEAITFHFVTVLLEDLEPENVGLSRLFT